jgi:hypothetical protein
LLSPTIEQLLTFRDTLCRAVISVEEEPSTDDLLDNIEKAGSVAPSLVKQRERIKLLIIALLEKNKLVDHEFIAAWTTRFI